MRATAVVIILLLAGLALPACGDDEPPAVTVQTPRPTAAGVRTTVQAYVSALNAGDGERACRRLDDRGKASVVAVLPSNQEGLGCADAVKRVARQAVNLRGVRIRDVQVNGLSATATVTGTQPPYSSGVLLAYEEGSWKISYPPGLQTKSGVEPGAAPGVPLEPD